MASLPMASLQVRSQARRHLFQPSFKPLSTVRCLWTCITSAAPQFQASVQNPIDKPHSLSRISPAPSLTLSRPNSTWTPQATPRDPSAHEPISSKRFHDFDLTGGTYIVTGGARGLGLSMASALAEAGGKVYCLDRLSEPSSSFYSAKAHIFSEFGSGSLHYGQIDVRNTESLNSVIGLIGEENRGIQGLIAAAGIQQICPATEYSVEDARAMFDVNYMGVFMTATAVARQMIKHKCGGSICLIGSMSGIVANKGLISPVYNSSKAAVTQLARNLAMEWGREHGIRVNTLSPGHIITPMVQKNFEEVPGLKETWEKENMLGRLAQPEEFKSAGVFLLSKASSFMTGSNLIIDGGHTAW